MGKSSPSPPPAPDYAGAATAQGAANVATATAQGFMNNPNVYGPLGNQLVTWNPVGEYQQPTITQSLTPSAQAALTSQQQVQQQLANLGSQGLTQASSILSQPFHYSGPGVQTSLSQSQPRPYNGPGIEPRPYYGPGYEMSQAQAQGPSGAPGAPSAGQYGLASGALNTGNVAAMPVNAGMTGQQAIMDRLAPQLERSDRATQQRLANQGLVPGGEAFENAMISQNQQKNDLLTQAALQGIGLDTAANAQGFNQALQAGQYGNQAIGQNFGQGVTAQQLQNAMQNQQYNQGLQSAQFGNTAQQQDLQQQLLLQNQPLNQILGLMSGSQIQMPQFQGYSGANVAPPPIFAGAQAAGQSAMDQYGIQSSNVNAQNAGLYNMIGSGASLGTAFLM